jgi:Poly(hydroxyalcanoate) granule associated protein (phasin)
MIQNLNAFLGTVARTDLGKATRRSARMVWNAHRAAFETTRHEAGKVFSLAMGESQKFSSRGREAADAMIGNLAGVADEKLTTIEQSLQQGVSRVIRRIGLPTAKDVSSLSHRIDALTARVESHSQKKSKRRATRRAA